MKILNAKAYALAMIFGETLIVITRFEILFYVGCDYNSHKNHTGGRS